MDQVVLVARPIDEKIGLIGGLRSRGETPRDAVDAVVLNAGAGSQGRKI